MSEPTRALGASDFSVPAERRFFEDYLPGAVYEYGVITLSEAEIIEFASRFDPQRMHVDQAHAAGGPYGGVIASGWHTASVLMRLFADHFLSRVATLPSPGIDELRWPHPVRPGDRLRLRTTIVESRVSKSKPDRGLVRTSGELFNQSDRLVCSLVAMNLIKLR